MVARGAFPTLLFEPCVHRFSLHLPQCFRLSRPPLPLRSFFAPQRPPRSKPPRPRFPIHPPRRRFLTTFARRPAKTLVKVRASRDGCSTSTATVLFASASPATTSSTQSPRRPNASCWQIPSCSLDFATWSRAPPSACSARTGPPPPPRAADSRPPVFPQA